MIIAQHVTRIVEVTASNESDIEALSQLTDTLSGAARANSQAALRLLCKINAKKRHPLIMTTSRAPLVSVLLAMVQRENPAPSIHQ